MSEPVFFFFLFIVVTGFVGVRIQNWKHDNTVQVAEKQPTQLELHIEKVRADKLTMSKADKKVYKRVLRQKRNARRDAGITHHGREPSHNQAAYLKAVRKTQLREQLANKINKGAQVVFEIVTMTDAAHEYMSVA